MAQRTAHISDYPQQVSLGSVTLCVPVTLSQQTVLPHSPAYHTLSILANENIVLGY